MSLNGVRLLVVLLMLWSVKGALAQEAKPFGDEFPNLDSLAIGEWWKKKTPQGPNPPPTMQVERDRVIAFAIYTVDRSVLKLTAQLYPLMPDETRSVRLEVEDGDAWKTIGKTDVVYPGWSAHFRIESWDGSAQKRYRIRHGEHAMLEGTIRQDPIHKETIVVANMSCNSSRTTGLRPEILENLMYQDPDLLFFSGDQTYRHTEHTAGWIEFGLQFRDVLKDRPAITIPDDHDVGHPNLWGENGKRSITKNNADGGYFYPVEYVNMVQRQQTWHLPDPVDPAPVDRGIGVYFTRYRLGGIDFAILEDRKFKSGPEGKIPKMGPRPDHINDPSYDPKSIDLPGLELLGSRQLRFLKDWSQDWTGATMKAVLSQTAFCGAVHMHGTRDGRLLADLDCNGWPQSGRNEALRWIRSAHAIHLCGISIWLWWFNMESTNGEMALMRSRALRSSTRSMVAGGILWMKSLVRIHVWEVHCHGRAIFSMDLVTRFRCWLMPIPKTSKMNANVVMDMESRSFIRPRTRSRSSVGLVFRMPRKAPASNILVGPLPSLPMAMMDVLQWHGFLP